jgi:hypothetical protein
LAPKFSIIGLGRKREIQINCLSLLVANPLCEGRASPPQEENPEDAEPSGSEIQAADLRVQDCVDGVLNLSFQPKGKSCEVRFCVA